MIADARLLTISTAGSRKATFWQSTTLRWSEFIDKLKTPVRSEESFEDYIRMGKNEQDKLKDVGGFVGGALRDGRRKANHVLSRDLLTLDLDNVPAGGTDQVLKALNALGCAYVVYSTRKHHPASPRLRVVWVTDRPVSPDEYEPLLRKMAELGGLLDYCDPSTFQIHRLMYWPSCCSNGSYTRYGADRPWLSVEGVLAMYKDWRDVAAWPQVPGTTPHKVLATKQGDPLSKDGIVGAFCRTYNIYDAMDKFLPGLYDATDISDRYTYAGGSTTGGAIIYDNGLFLYSHHATDPCSGMLVNAFDLVRLHKFGDLDAESPETLPVNRRPSFTEMRKFTVEDEATANTLWAETHTQAAEVFDAEDQNWHTKLKKSKESGLPLKTINNVWVILEHDPRLKGKFALNEFAGRGEVLGALPWNERTDRRFWEDNDNDGLYWYIENEYQLSCDSKVDSALSLHSTKHAFNDIKNYLAGLVWDGTRRLDRLFIDYLGAEDNEYTRAVTRKAFMAAVARAMRPGTKFDPMTILSGPQGIGKSTLLAKMARGWFNDSIRTFEGKEASELLQGVWLVEISELDAFRRSDVSRIKQFLSLTTDRFRAAYGRHVKEIPRCCVFFGTTNCSEYLQDKTGNRRFWPIDTGVTRPAKSIWTQLDSEIDQLWAEAVNYWRLGEALYLSDDLEEQAKAAQEEHREASTKEGIILDFLSSQIPVGWSKWPPERRNMFWSGGAIHGETKLEERDQVCALEVWCEALGQDIRAIRNSDAAEINGIIEMSGKWAKMKKPSRFGHYKMQRGFTRKGATI